MSDLQKRIEALPHGNFEVDPVPAMFGPFYSEKAVVGFQPLNEKTIQIHWAAERGEDLVALFDQQIKALQPHALEMVMEFVPPAFMPALTAYGFREQAVFCDMWNRDLENAELSSPAAGIEIRPITDADMLAAAEITQACREVSRGFGGEKAEWLAEWCHTEHQTAFLALAGGEPVGVALTALYAFDSPKGACCWLRELAVKPEMQGKGIGRALSVHVLKWGLTKGAKRSFLAVDRENQNAIKLYRNMGYEFSGDEQINMIIKIV